MKTVNCLQWNLKNDNVSLADVIRIENITENKHYFKVKGISVAKLIAVFIISSNV